ncbi:MAG: thioredoxin domain-containing protein [Leptospirales bacterium]
MNSLAKEKSPYLLQHKDNPVMWRPWSPESFQIAQKEDKPIFLSIGYSTCHWCHVMEEESFENSKVAKILNESFVSIKVDREERPDIDRIYMDICIGMTGNGGWPLTIVMTPGQEAFYATTYMPAESKYGKIGLLEILPRIVSIWAQKKTDLEKTAKRITKVVNKSEEGYFKTTKSIFDKAFTEIRQRFDMVYGGFSGRPKFPMSHSLSFLLRYYSDVKNNNKAKKEALAMVQTTLANMRLGGIFDHIGFGFHRYATDETWLLPHFEKMLYDQASLAIVYTEAFFVTRNPAYRDTVDKIFSYVEQDLTSTEGAFYTAEDADCEGQEGAYYMFSKEQVMKLLNKSERDFFHSYFPITDQGNFIDEAQGEPGGQNVFYINSQTGKNADHFDISKLREKNFTHRWEPLRKKIYNERKKRARPFKDDKILTDINGLMIAAYAKAGFHFSNEDYLRRAEKAARFVISNLEKSPADQNYSQLRLFHRYRDGESGIEGMLDDYIFFTKGLIELFQVTGKVEYLEKSILLMQTACEQFWDKKRFGFFMTANDSDTLITRPKEFFDGALPSGNSIALSNCYKLYKLTGESKWKSFAERMVEAASYYTSVAPSSFTAFLSSLYYEFASGYEIVIVYPASKTGLEGMLNVLRKSGMFHYTLLLKEEKNPRLDKLASYTNPMQVLANTATVYLCKDHTCQKPITGIQEFQKKISRIKN